MEAPAKYHWFNHEAYLIAIEVYGVKRATLMRNQGRFDVEKPFKPVTGDMPLNGMEYGWYYTKDGSIVCGVPGELG